LELDPDNDVAPVPPVAIPAPDEENGIVNDVPPLGWTPDIRPLHLVWINAARLMRERPEIELIARREAEISRSRAARELVAGNDAPMLVAEETLPPPSPHWLDEPVP